MRVLIAEDSAVAREHLCSLLGDDPEISVVGTARNGLEAVEQSRELAPDVVLMDVTMPRMGGYEATRQIMAITPVPIVMMSTGFDAGGVATTFDSLKAGAVAVVEKPAGGSSADQEASARELCETVKLMAEVKVVRRWAKRGVPAAEQTPQRMEGRPPVKIQRPVEIAVLGASTGGPAVVAEILSHQTANLNIPILLVQHITRGFGAGFAAWLNEQTPLRVKLAEPFERLAPGVVYLAPDDRQMGIAAGSHIHLTDEPPEAGFRPSISYTFRAAAARCGGATLAILLTGMGQDGSAGLLRVREAGGITIVQDQATSVIFGMPERAIRLGAAKYVLPPLEIAHTLRSVAAGPSK